jgi:lipoyl-dependent peroxiredoxin
MKRSATAVWNGTLKEGKGTISTESKALESIAYSFSKRFENEPGTNPEELIAAAHAGCFSMAFSANLGKEDITPEAVETKGTVSLEKQEAGFSITKSHLQVVVKVPGGDKDRITSAAEAAKAGCPVARALSIAIEMDLTIET